MKALEEHGKKASWKYDATSSIARKKINRSLNKTKRQNEKKNIQKGVYL
jgi:hypothetical protein